MPVGGAAGVEASAVAEAVRWAAAVAPFRALCLQQGLACQVMLRRRGVDARLHYGVAMQDGRMEAHVWVSTGGTVVLGTEEARRFREVASFPA